MTPSSGPLRILAAPAFSNAGANPYNAALYGELQRRGCLVREFSRRALIRRWDVVHIHWPDNALNQPNHLAARAAAAGLLAKIVIAKGMGARVIWTIHNLKAHDTLYREVEQWMWRHFVTLIDGAISLSTAGWELAMERFPALAATPHFVIRHGDYRGRYPNLSDRRAARRALGLEAEHAVFAFVGQIRPYKNLDKLIGVFRDEATAERRLVIAGKPATPADEAHIASAARGDSRIRIDCGLIASDAMQLYLNACDLAVFPYREILNSGSAILALSFDRPVLVPRLGAMAELQEVAGSSWVKTYDGEISRSILDEAMHWAQQPRHAPCDLSLLKWDAIAEQTEAAYRSVLSASSHVEAAHAFTSSAPVPPVSLPPRER